MAAELAFAPGELLQTEPYPGYWGCAIVLSAYPQSAQMHPQFHIGITPIVMLHEYELSEIDTSNLSIMKVTRKIRLEPFTYGTLPEETCIGIYTAKSRSIIRVLGRVDPKPIYSRRLTRRIGDGTKGNFGLHGPLRKNIGHDAVAAWRSIHDAEAAEKEGAKAAAEFEAFDAKRLADQREAARLRKSKKR